MSRDVGGKARIEDENESAKGGREEAHFLRRSFGVMFLLWLAFCLPLLVGQRTLIHRDVFSVHLPLAAHGAAELKEGRIPAVDTSWGLGRPFRGNPNAMAYYPSKLFYLVLPFWSAFHLHFVLHWLLAGVAMALLAKRLGQGTMGTATAALAYAGGGYVITALSFYNILAVVAWLPVAAAGAASMGVAWIWGGMAWALVLLAGEPVTAALGAVVVWLAAVATHGWIRGTPRALGVGLFGLALSAPQWVGFLRLLPFTSRGAIGMESSQVSAFSLETVRFFELFLPFPKGVPGRYDALGAWLGARAPESPFVMSFFAGFLIVPLAWAAIRGARERVTSGGGELPAVRPGGRPPWTAVVSFGTLALAGLAVAWIGGFGGELLQSLSAGLFRFPEKFLVWTAVGLALLAGWGMDAMGRRPAEWHRPLRVGGALLGAFGLSIVLVAVSGIGEGLVAGWLDGPSTPESAADAWLFLWGLSLLVSGAAWWWSGLGLRAGTNRNILVIQMLGIVPLLALAPSDSIDPYSGPSPLFEALGERRAVWNPGLETLAMRPLVVPHYRLRDPAERQRARAHDLSPAPGILAGLEYPTGGDIDGLSPPLVTLVLRRLGELDPREQYRWLRVLGVEALVLPSELGWPLAKLAEVDRAPGGKVALYEVENPAPRAWWPESFEEASGVGEALGAIAVSPDAVRRPVVVGAMPQQGRGRVSAIRAWNGDRMELEVESDGGVVVFRRAFSPLYEARVGDRELRTRPINVCLLGVEVPAGRHVVEVEISSTGEKSAGALALVAALSGCLWLSRKRGVATTPPEGTLLS